MDEPGVVIAGGGVAGLACAAALARAKLRVTVLEQGGACGGRARSWRDDVTGDEVDIGPHVVSTEHRHFLHLLEMLGTADRLRWQPSPLITLLDAGETLRMVSPAWVPPLHGIPNLPQALRRLGWADVLSHLRIGWEAMRLGEHDAVARLDGTDALAHLRAQGVSERAIDWFWRSAMLALLNVPLEHCSAAAAMRVFRLMIGRSGYHFGFPTVGLSQLYVPACIRAVESAGGRVLTGTAVERLHVADGRIEAVGLSGGEVLAAWQVVLALPPAEAATVARSAPALDALSQAAATFQPSPYVSTMLWFDRPLTSSCFWARVWQPDGLNTDFYDLSNIRPSLAGGPAVIAANSIGPMVRDHWSDDEVVARTRREIEDFAPAARQAALRHARVHRIAMAIPQPRPGTEARRPPNATALQGLWLAGDWTDTAIPCSMESAARSGLLAAQGVLAALGQPARLAMPPPDTTGLVALLRCRSRA